MDSRPDPTLGSLARGLPRSALDTLFAALSKLPADRAARGRVLAEPANVTGVGADSRGVRANVSDGHQYVTRWAWGDDGATSLCSCPAGRACEHAFALGMLLLAAARESRRWDHARWARVAPASLATGPVAIERGIPRHEHAVEALAQWADRGPTEPRRLRAVLHLEPVADGIDSSSSRAQLTLEARVTAPGVRDAPRTWRQLDQLAGELKRHPRLMTPPESRLLRALTSVEFSAGALPGGTRIELTSERLQALFDRVPESPHFTWSADMPEALAAHAGVEPGARANLHADEVRMAPVCDTSVEPPRLELSLEWTDGATRPLAEVLMLSPLGLTAGGRTHVALAGGRFVRIADEPPREVLKLLQEGGLELHRNDGAVLEKLSRSFPIVRSALQRLTRVHDVDVIGSFELSEDDWLRVRVFAAARAVAWSPGAVPPEGAVFEYRPALGWMRLAPGEVVSADVQSVQEEPREPADANAPADAAAEPVPANEPAAAANGVSPAPESAWFDLPDPDHVAPVVEWVEALPAGDTSGKKKRGARAPHAPLGAAPGWWLRLTPGSMEALADAWDIRPHGVRWFADRGASGLFRTRHAVPTVRVTSTGMDWFTVSAEWQAEGLSLREEDLSLLRASRSP